MFKPLVLSLFVLFLVSAPVCAKISLSQSEKAQLRYKHSIIKSGGPVMKKSTLNSIHAKLKRENKAKKQSREAAGI